jgi:hypothetical protein
MGKGIVKLGEGQWAVKDGNLLAAKETNGRFKNTEFTVSRGTRASYVGRDGLIKESNLQDVNLVNNGDFSELGSELVTNGNFNDGLNGWNNNATYPVDNLSVVNNKLELENISGSTQVFTSDSFNVTSGETYKISLDTIKESGVDDFDITLRATALGTVVETITTTQQTGSLTYYFTSSSTQSIVFQFTLRDTIKGSIDNISVKEVDPNDYWTLGTGWSIQGGVVKGDGASFDYVAQGISGLRDKTIKLTFEIKDWVSGTFRVLPADRADGLDERYSGNGTYQVIYTSNTDLFRFQQQAFNGSIDNISIQEVKTDTPRIDFTDNTDGHLLLEPQSTNLVPYSEDFSEWTIQSGTTVTSNTTETLSPSGEYNSSKIVGNGTSGILKSYLSSLGGSNTKSIFIKGTQNGQVVYLKDPNQTVNNKALTLTTEWVRYSLTETQTSHYGIWISNIPTEGIYMWGGQVEALSYPTSYIPTNGSTVTRDADTCTGAGSSADFNSEEGVLYAEISALADSTTTTIFSLSNGTNANSLYMGFSSTSNTIQAQLVVGNVAQTNMNYVVTDRTQFNKVAVLYENNNHKMYINGSEVAVDTSGSVPSANTFDRLNFDLGQGSFDFYGKVKAVRVYKEALSDTDLQNLTS